MDIERIDWWTEPFGMWVESSVEMNDGSIHMFTHFVVVNKESREAKEAWQKLKDESELKLFFKK